MNKQFKYCQTILKNYVGDRSGQFAVWFGVAAFPVLVATSMALDFRSTEANRDAIKRALDVAVLASVSNDTTDANGKTKIAKDVFNTHYVGDVDLDLTVEVSDGRVEMNAKGIQEASISRAVGNKGFQVDETSIAEMTRQNTICVLALAEEGPEKLRFLGRTEFNSPTCSVQSNSRDAEGILSNSSYTPVAKSFCSAGGAKGEFKPNIRGECRIVEDPYKDREVPDSGVCMPTTIFTDPDSGGPGLAAPGGGTDTRGQSNGNSMLGVNLNVNPINVGGGKHRHYHCHVNNPNHCHMGSHPVDTPHAPVVQEPRLIGLGVTTSEASRLLSDYGLAAIQVTESANYTGEDSVFYPGTYCGGLTVDGQNVTFLPGIYIMKDGPLTFKNGASAYAEDVSFVLKGETSVVTVETDSYVWVKAPRNGPMAGMAFYQDRDGDGTSGAGTASGLARMMTATSSEGMGSTDTGPTAVNLISSGGELNVTGTMYFPTQALEVVGDSVLGARAPATSFIAHQVTFSGETRAAISVNHVAGKIPPMEPRSDDGARLVE